MHRTNRVSDFGMSLFENGHLGELQNRLLLLLSQHIFFVRIVNRQQIGLFRG